MASDFTRGRFYDDIIKKEEQARQAFEEVNIEEFVWKSYENANTKAKEGLDEYIREKIKSFRDETYSETDFVNRLNEFKQLASRKYQDDNSDYRRVLKSVLDIYPDRESHEFFISFRKTFADVINGLKESYSNKLLYLEGLENNIYNSSRIELIFLYFKKQEKTPSELKIEAFSKLISSYYFKDTLIRKFPNGKDNPTYYQVRINRFTDHFKNLTKQVEHLEDRVPLCNDFIALLGQFMQESVKLGMHLLKYELQKHDLSDNQFLAMYNLINMIINDLEMTLNVLQGFSTNIRLNVSEGHYKAAIALKIHLLTLLENSIETLKNWMFLDLMATPLSTHLIKIKHAFNESYDLSEIELLIKANTKVKKVVTQNANNFSQKQIAIAYFMLRITITEDNYLSILKKHSQTTSNKILQKRVSKSSDLTSLKYNRTSDTKHLNDLKAAKRLLSGMKKEKEIKALEDYISTFKAKYEAHY